MPPSCCHILIFYYCHYQALLTWLNHLVSRSHFLKFVLILLLFFLKSFILTRSVTTTKEPKELMIIDPKMQNSVYSPPLHRHVRCLAMNGYDNKNIYTSQECFLSPHRAIASSEAHFSQALTEWSGAVWIFLRKLKFHLLWLTSPAERDAR